LYLSRKNHRGFSRVTARDLHDVNVADAALLHDLMDALEVAVKAPVEADLVFDAGGLNGFDHGFDPVQVVIDGLLAENVLARPGGFDGNGRVCVRGGADKDRCFVLSLITQARSPVEAVDEAQLEGVRPGIAQCAVEPPHRVISLHPMEVDGLGDFHFCTVVHMFILVA